MRMLAEDELREAVLLIFANKQDLPNAMNAAEITDKLGLHSLRNRNWYIQVIFYFFYKTMINIIFYLKCYITYSYNDDCLIFLGNLRDIWRWSLWRSWLAVKPIEERSALVSVVSNVGRIYLRFNLYLISKDLSTFCSTKSNIEDNSPLSRQWNRPWSSIILTSNWRTCYL